MRAAAAALGAAAAAARRAAAAGPQCHRHWFASSSSSPSPARRLRPPPTAAGRDGEEAIALSNLPAQQEQQQQQSFTLLATGERGTRALARLLASAAGDRRAGDCYFLHGPVGAGKSAFSRAFVRAAVGDPYLPVPSPTFLLLNTYEVVADDDDDDVEAGDGDGHGHGNGNGNGNAAAPTRAPPVPIHHFDLYRLDPVKTTPAELVRLDIPGALASGVALVEWPERLVAIAAAATGAAASAADAATAEAAALVPASRVDVYVEPLAEEDPARLALAEALRQTGAGGKGATPLRVVPGGGGRTAAGASEEGDDEEDEEDDEDDEDEDDSPYADRRWRRWTLVPTTREWDERLRARIQKAEEEARRGDLFVVGGD